MMLDGAMKTQEFACSEDADGQNVLQSILERTEFCSFETSKKCYRTEPTSAQEDLGWRVLC